MNKRLARITIIGSGNVATHLACGFKGAAEIVQIFSRTLKNAEKLAKKSGGKAIDDISRLTDADVYIIAVKDDAIVPMLSAVPDSCKGALWLHTSGSVGKEVFSGFNSRHGVFYPLQTFSAEVALDLKNVPFFIEGSSTETSNEIAALAKLLSPNVYEADSPLRMRMHIAAVFASNFSNYMYTLANGILERNGLPFSVLTPLIEECVRKIEKVFPEKAQTGPAVRGDRSIIEKHIKLLEGEEKEIYQILSEAILKRYNR